MLVCIHFNTGGGCPNCLLEGEEVVERRREELRLEAIKRQILSKLGLAARPNVSSAALPRELVLETVNRAEEGTTLRPELQTNPPLQDGADETSEIIAFAEPGTV